MIRARIGLAALAFLALTPGARADEASRATRAAREVSAGWIVLPGEAPAPRVVHPHEFVFRQRLVAFGIAKLDADVVDAGSNKLLLPAGTPLFRLHSTSGLVACAFDTERHSLGNFLTKSGSVRVCVRDADLDGRFDDYAHYVGAVSGLPSVNGRLPRTLSPLKQSVAYTVADPNTGPPDLFVGIRYEGKAPLTGVPLFVIAFGRGDDIGSLDRAWARGDGGKGKLGQTGTALLAGAVIEVTALDGDDATLTVHAMLPAGQFAINQAGRNGFY
jgi:hypothetical protein